MPAPTPDAPRPPAQPTENVLRRLESAIHKPPELAHRTQDALRSLGQRVHTLRGRNVLATLATGEEAVVGGQVDAEVSTADGASEKGDTQPVEASVSRNKTTATVINEASISKDETQQLIDEKVERRARAITFLRKHIWSLRIDDPESVVDLEGTIHIPRDQQEDFIKQFRKVDTESELFSIIGSLGTFDSNLVSAFVDDHCFPRQHNAFGCFDVINDLVLDSANASFFFANSDNYQLTNIERLIGGLSIDISGPQVAKWSENQARNFFNLISQNNDFSTILERQPDFVTFVLRHHPEAIQALHIDQLTEARQVNIARVLLQRDAPDFSNGDEAAIAVGIGFRSKAIEIIESLPQDQQDQLTPLVIDHLIDVDYGDLVLAHQIASRVADPQLKLDLESKIPDSLEETRRTPERIKRLHHVDATVNAERLYQELVAQHGKTAVDETIARTRENAFYSINISLNSLSSMLAHGRALSNWDGSGRYVQNGIQLTSQQDAKDQTEKALGIRGKGSEKDPHPIYGAVGFRNGSEELVGAVGEWANGQHRIFGNCHIKINPKYVEDTAIFFLGDSMTGSLDKPEMQQHLHHRVVDLDGAMVGKAAIGLDPDFKERTFWIETILTQGLPMDQITEVVIPKTELDTGSVNLDELRRLAPQAIFTVVQ